MGLDRFVVLLLYAFQAFGLTEFVRPLVYGAPAALLFIGFIALESKFEWPGFMLLLGNASYSIYLIHTLVIYYATRRTVTFDKLGLPAISTDLASIFGVLLAIVSGLLFFHFVETPLLRLSHSIYDKLTGRRKSRRQPCDTMTT